MLKIYSVIYDACNSYKVKHTTCAHIFYICTCTTHILYLALIMELFFLLQKDNSRRYKYIYIYICFVVKLSVSIEYSEKKESKRSLFRERTTLLIVHPLWVMKKSNFIGMPFLL